MSDNVAKLEELEKDWRSIVFQAMEEGRLLTKEELCQLKELSNAMKKIRSELA
jgi:hypothetical protein